MEAMLFEEWTDDHTYLIGLKKVENCELLEKWLNSAIKNTEKEKLFVTQLLEKYEDRIGDFNKAELYNKLLGPITELVSFEDKTLHLGSYLDRYFEVPYKSIKLKGRINWLASIGFRDPFHPIFFVIHPYEYNEKLPSTSRSQLMAMMLAVQTKNHTPLKRFIAYNPYLKQETNMPVYGICILGQWWTFAILKGEEYAMSYYYDSSKKEDLLQIISILKKQKQMIINRIEAARKPNKT